MTLVNITEEEWASFQERYEKLRENEELYRVALSLTDHTITVVDIPSRTLNQIYNEGDYTGIASSMADAPESIIATGIIHPDDADGYRRFYDDIYMGVPEGECTMRVMEENRGWVWFTMYYRTVFAEDGSPLRAIAFSDDITARKKAELMYEQYYSSVTRDANYIWEVDLDHDLLLKIDDESKKLFAQNGFTKFSEISHAAYKSVPDEYRMRVRETFSIDNLLKEFNRARREVMLEYPFKPVSSDSDRWVQSTAYMTATPEGDVNAIICIRDVTERKHEEERLRQEAEHDSLCDLYNRKAFEQRVNDLLKNDRRVQGGHLYMIDIDDFKEVNDCYGHVFGDEMLQCVADTLRKFFRNEDVIGRVGGDEFMAFVQNIDSIRAEERAEKIMGHILETCNSKGLDQPITLSIGIAEANEYDGFVSLYKKADKALYRSKLNGKNRWTVWRNESSSAMVETVV